MYIGGLYTSEFNLLSCSRSCYQCWACDDSGEKGLNTDENCNLFLPKGLDYTLQNDDSWFYDDSTTVRELAELQTVYHNSVGRNTVLELDFAVSKTGKLHPTHKTRYKEFGDWIRSCYGDDNAVGFIGNIGKGWSASIAIESTATADRVVIREDQTRGQRIISYEVYAQHADGTTTVLSTGNSVGNKRIDLFEGGTVVKGNTTIIMHVIETVDGSAPTIGSFAAYGPDMCT